MSRTPLCALVTALLLVAAAEAKLKVALHEPSCSPTSLDPPAPYTSITTQIYNSGFLEPALVSDADIDTVEKLSRYDVVFVGTSGMDVERDKLGAAAAQALVDWVMNSGGGVVFASPSHMDHASVKDILAPILPVLHSDDSHWCKFNYPLGPSLTVVPTRANHSLWHALPYAFFLTTYAFVSPAGVNPEAVSLAKLDPYGGTCCTSQEKCGVTFEEVHSQQGVMYLTPGSGRAVWLSMPFCGFELYQPDNLRNKGTPEDTLFKNALAWASGKCKAVDDCGEHGVCSGPNKCHCDEAWQGNSKCTRATKPVQKSRYEL